MGFVGVAFGILFFLVIHFSIEASNEKKRRQKNENELKSQRQIMERKIKTDNAENKIKDFIVYVQNSDEKLDHISYRKKRYYKEWLLGNQFTRECFCTSLNFENTTYGKTVNIDEYPNNKSLEIRIYIYNIELGYSNSANFNIDNYYDEDIESLKETYNQEDIKCRNFKT